MFPTRKYSNIPLQLQMRIGEKGSGKLRHLPQITIFEGKTLQRRTYKCAVLNGSKIWSQFSHSIFKHFRIERRWWCGEEIFVWIGKWLHIKRKAFLICVNLLTSSVDCLFMEKRIICKDRIISWGSKKKHVVENTLTVSVI